MEEYREKVRMTFAPSQDLGALVPRSMAPISFSEPPPSQQPQTETLSGTGKFSENDVIIRSPTTTQTTSRIPIVSLDVDFVTDTIAARLATSLLGHVLYLKNQIPLPIVQLGRVSSRKNNTKAAKMKAELLSSVDTLTSHLVTTFSALSTALAKSSSSESASISRVYIAILVGPSLGTAKSKVIYGVDSFAIRVWGTRDDEHHADEDEGDDSGEERPEDSEDDESDEGACSEGTGTEDDVSDDDVESIEGARGVQEGKVEEQPEEESTEEENDQAGKKKENTMQYHHHQLSPSPHQSYAEEQRFLQAADRMLARALASADAEGRGISNEMSPSQIYILIRAPRRFVHSAWVPRQNLTNQMEATWSDFIDESWRVNDGLSPKKKKPVEGVWVTARGGLRGPKASSESVAVQEDDEMIWWSWDGKLVGFSDW